MNSRSASVTSSLVLVIVLPFLTAGGCPPLVPGLPEAFDSPAPGSEAPGLPPKKECSLAVIVQGCGSVEPGSGFYEKGAAVTVTARPAEGWDFVRWEGDVTGDEAEQNPLTIVLEQDRILTTVFERGIIPGVAIGPIGLGDSALDLDRALGAPTGLGTGGDPSAPVVFFYYEELGLGGALADFDKDGRPDSIEPVVMIIADSPFAGTLQGVGVNSPEYEVLELMGDPEEVHGADYWYPRRGIVWTVEQGVVSMLGVFSPATPAENAARSKGSAEEPLYQPQHLLHSLRLARGDEY